MIRRLLALSLALAPAVVVAQTMPPKLIVVISVDQFSADLFAEYRSRWTGGMKRLATGAVFPSGYQSHAATETCPGHSTILTGDHPARTGVIQNGWIDQNVARADKSVYCAEDETVGASSKPGVYVPSPAHLRVPTLGDRMKDADPRSRVVSVAGKDRAAIMMGGHKTDQIWWLRPTDYAKFETLQGRTDTPTAVTRANATIDAALTHAMPPMPIRTCADHARTVAIGPGKTVGNGRFARDKGDAKLFRASPESDAVTLSLAGDLASDMKLGRGPVTDLLIVGVSATDVVGHAYGTEGSEMCLQLATLDTNMGRLFDRLDRSGVDYLVVLTADHGGHDAVERNDENAIPDAHRVTAALRPSVIGGAVSTELGLTMPALVGDDPDGNVWISAAVPANRRAATIASAKAHYLAEPQVAAVFTADEIAAQAKPTRPADEWSLIDRATASFDRARSGDLVVLLKPRITPITVESAQKGYVATHGSPWNYDRRVPILFWRKGMAGFEQPNAIETVDIAPTLAAIIGLPVATGEMDGRCLDIQAGAGTICR